MGTRQYDLNAYITDGVIHLSAYEHEYSDSENPQPISTRIDPGSWHTLEIPLVPENNDEIVFLLDEEDWLAGASSYDEVAEAWEDTDLSWEQVDHYATAPARIRDWVGALPEYEPKQVHDWEDAPFDLEYGERRDVKCKNCDATYEQRRLSWDEMRGLK